MSIFDNSDIIIQIINYLTEKREWENMFSEIGDDILDMEFDKGELLDQLRILFSKENLLKESKKLEKISDYDLLDELESHLSNYFMNKGLYSTQRKKYIHIYMKLFKKELKIKFPEKYDRIFNKDFRNENKSEHQKIESSLNNLITEINTNKNLNISTIKGIEQWYKNNTEKKCSLKLFNYKNKEFEEILLECLNNNKLYIQGETIKEVVAYLAYLFSYNGKFKKFSDDILIVNDEKSWNDIKKQSLINKIIIANFSNISNIDFIENNICIYIYSKNEYTKNKEIINLEKRLFSNLIDCLKSCGYSSNEAYDIGRYSKNNYTILMRIITLGKESKPLWADIDSEIILPALIMNCWIDNEGDKEVLDYLLNEVTYDQYISMLLKKNDFTDPFLIKYKTYYNRTKFIITDPEAAWYYYSPSLTSEINKKIIDLIDLVIFDISPKFDLEIEMHHMANIIGKKSDYSDDFRRKFAENLVYLSKLRNPISDLIKKRIYNGIREIDSSKKWFGISEVLSLLVEIYPEAVIEKLENDLEKNESIIKELFIKKSNGLVFGRQYFTHILWTLEKALFITNYEFRVVRILTIMLDFDIEYNISNSPENTLYNSLVAWNHNYIYSVEDKISFLKYIVENSKNGWNLLRKLLPSKSGSSCSNLSKPKHIEYELSNELKYNNQIYDTYCEYYRIALENIDSIDKLCDIYENANFFDFNIYEEIKQITYIILKSLEDSDKYKLYKKIHKLIHKNRKFKNSNWAIKEEKVKLLESEIFEKIKFKDHSFKHQFYFESHRDFLLNPIIYDSNHETIEANDIKGSKVRKKEFEKLIDLNIDWCKFILRFETRSSNIIGKFLGKSKDSIKFIEHISECLINTNKSAVLDAFYTELITNNEIYVVNNFLDSETLSKEKYLKILFNKIQINDKFISIIENLSDENKKLFWENINVYKNFNDELKDYIFQNLIEYKNSNALLEFTHNYRFKTEDYVKVLETLLEKPLATNTMTSYYIGKIFDEIHNDNFPRVDISEKIMSLEIYNIKRNFKRDKLKYTKYYLSKHPEFTANLLLEIFESSKKEISKSSYNKQIGEIAYSIFEKAKFSPVNNGVGELDSEKLIKWCEKYVETIVKNDQENIGYQYLGKILFNSKENMGDNYPPEALMKVIEKFYNDDLRNGFEIEAYNSIGLRSISDGSNLKNLSIKYNEYANKSKKYPKIQKIFNNISKKFKNEYKNEREFLHYE